MDNLNEKYCITKKIFCDFINRLCNKRCINNQISVDEDDFTIIKKLNKILLSLKLLKMSIGINILDQKIENLISLDKTKFNENDIQKLFIYFYFFNSINDLFEMPKALDDVKLQWQYNKQIMSDINLDKRYSFINGEIYLNK